jgi:F5/8 type C domain-containing protein
MPKPSLILLLSFVGLLACVPSPVKKGDAGTINIIAGGDTAGATGTSPTGDAGSSGSGSAGTIGGTAGGTAGDPIGGTAGDPSGTAGDGDPDDAGPAGATGSAGVGEAGATGTAGASIDPTGSAGAAADGGADAHDASPATPDAPVITDPCDHRAWTFTPSVVCTTACTAMADGQKLPANAIDGDTTTRYTTGITQGSKGPEVVILSFPQNVTLTGLNLFTKSGDGPIAYLVESSLDGANFSYFMPSAAGPGSDNLTVTFPAATKLRALRITQTGVKKTNWWSIHELTVKGCVATP